MSIYRLITKNSRKNSEILEHYTLEKMLADKLKKSNKSERLTLYNEVYDELFTKINHHPQLRKKEDDIDTRKRINWQYKLISRFIDANTEFAEIGAGDCRLCLLIAEHVKNVYAIEVSKIISDNKTVPNNFHLKIINGVDLMLENNSIDIVYSNQLMEHLHEEDAIEQLQSIYNALRPRGKYICITPNKVSGPWDISVFFDKDARGFHLKEYTVRELIALFKEAGFTHFKLFVGARGVYIKFFITPIVLLEKLLWRLPNKLRLLISRNFIFRSLLGIRLVAYK